MAKLLFYIIILPLSRMPLWFLYGLARFLLFWVYNVLGYRKSVVTSNLFKSFPQKNATEIDKIVRAFYLHFSELWAEGLKAMSISKEELLARYRVINPELVEDLYAKKQSVILVSGHYNNWEFMVQSLNLHFSHKGVGVGKDISSDDFEAMVNKSRKRFGMTIWYQKNVRQRFAEVMEKQELITCMLLADQSPNEVKKAFWMRFLHQNTPVIFGPEYFAKKYNIPVFYYEVLKVKRGFYEIKLTPITYTPQELPHGEITYQHTKMLESTIQHNPAYWLWSHKRWKHSHKAAHFEIRI